MVDEYAPAYPPQRADISYGRTPSGAVVYFTPPTPGAANPESPTFSGVAAIPSASVRSGLFNQPFAVVLSTETPGASIYYSLDGSAPGPTNTLYAGPIPIAGNSNQAVVLLRAAAFRTGYLPSDTMTRTYLFPDYVVYQPNIPAGFPAIWDSPCSVGNNCADIPADYEMDPQIVTNGNNAAIIRAGLLKLPTLSIVTDVQLLFGPAKGVYVRREDFNQQPVNVEWILPDNSGGFNVPAGLEIQGGTSPYDQGTTWKSKKLSMRLVFKGDFGAKSLDYPLYPDSPVTKFNTLVLDNGLNHVWHYNGGSSPEQQRQTAQYVRDQFISDLQVAAGAPSAHWRFAHVYLDGLYWGITGLHERPDDKWAEEYYGGDSSEYDVLRHNNNNIVAGANTVYNQMFTVARSGLTNNATYESLQQQYLDLPAFIDYMIINFWAGNEDWAHQNWYALRRRTPGAGWRYVSWDAEHVVEHLTQNSVTLNNSYGPTELYQLLKQNREFRVAFGDHVHKLYFNGGILSVASNAPVNIDNPGGNKPAGIYLKRIKEVEGALVGESARWGDSATTTTDRSNNPLTRDGDWLRELFALMGWTNAGGEHASSYNYFPNRSATALAQLKTDGTYPNIAAPAFSQHGGRVPAGYALQITNVQGNGTVYYTTNGADPRVYASGAVSPLARAYTAGQPVILGQSALVRARALVTTNWSALNEAVFTVGGLGVPLRVTEIMYNPLGGDPYEFIELYNAGNTPLDLSGCTFDGISYTFPPGSILTEGALLVLASSASTNDFAVRYPGVTVFGYFGNALNNGGERIELKTPAGQVVFSLDYNDANGWPTAADGLGYSLEVINVNGDPDDPANWRASSVINGTPGLLPTAPPPAVVVLNEVMADNVSAVNNGGTFPDWIELRNTGAAPVDLSGWSLSDDGNARKFVFPPQTSLAAGGYLVVWCDTATTAPGLHTGFPLARNGASVFLYDALTNRIDAVTLGLQLPDYAVGRIGTDWVLTAPTPNTANLAATLGSASGLVINEWLANALPGMSDWIELHNRSASPVALRGIYLGTSNGLGQVRSLSFVAPAGFVQLFADQTAGPDHLDFNLPKEGGPIVLYDNVGALIDQIVYGPQVENVSQGRLPDGAANIVSFAGSQSPGASNYVVSYSGAVVNEVMARNQSAVVGPYGEYADWIELRNPNATAFDLSGMSLSDSAATPGRWVFPQGVSIPASGYLVVWCDGGRAASTNATSALNAGFALNGSGGGVHLFNAQGQRVDGVEYGFQLPDASIGLSGGQWRLMSAPTPGAPNAAPAALGAVSNLCVNEWMANPLTGPDWFEIFNRDPLPVDMGGLYLADSPSIAGVTNYQVAPLTFIAGRGWVLWYADGDPNQGRDHVNFNLAGAGETIRIYSSPSNLLEAVDFGLQAEGVSQGRLPDGAAAIVSFPTSASPGAANYLPLTNVVVNEVLAHTDAPLEDAIELHNPTAAAAVNIGGWYLSNAQGDPKRYRIPDGTLIQPGGFKVFYEYQFNTNNGVPPSFRLNSAHGDTVYLSEADAAGNLTGWRAGVEFGASENAVSFGRHLTSVGVDFVAMSARTFGVDNPATVAQFRTGTGLSNAYPRVGPVVINEIMYHPVTGSGTNLTELANEEFIELRNISASNVPLFDPVRLTNHWRLAGGVQYEFPGNAVLNAGQYLLVVRFDPVADAAALASFRAKYGVATSVPVYGPWSGRLDNAGESLELYKPDPPQTAPSPDAGFVPLVLVDRVRYDDLAPWPLGADGGGASLQRITSSLYGNDPVNWKAEPPTAGRENAQAGPLPPTIDAQPQDLTVVAGQPATFSVVASGTAPLSYQWQFDGGDIPAATAASYTIPSATAGDEGSYRVRVANSVDSILSQPATLTVLVPPVITALSPSNQVVAAGSNVVISANATGTAPLRYQWHFNGAVLGGQTAAALSLNSAQPPQSGSYRVVVTNVAGMATSGVATVTVLVPPAITAQPQSQTVSEGSNAVFSVSVTGDLPLSYQWFVGPDPVTGATGPMLTVNSAQLADDGKVFTVQVSNPVGQVMSMPALLSVVTRPVLTDAGHGPATTLRFTVSGQAGRSYFLEVSSNLTSWVTLTNSTYANGQTVVVDTSASGARQQFYRLRVGN